MPTSQCQSQGAWSCASAANFMKERKVTSMDIVLVVIVLVAGVSLLFQSMSKRL